MLKYVDQFCNDVILYNIFESLCLITNASSMQVNLKLLIPFYLQNHPKRVYHLVSSRDSTADTISFFTFNSTDNVNLTIYHLSILCSLVDHLCILCGCWSHSMHTCCYCHKRQVSLLLRFFFFHSVNSSHHNLLNVTPYLGGMDRNRAETS